MNAIFDLSFHTTIDGESEQSRQQCEGTYTPFPGGYTIAYTELLDGASTDVTIEITESRTTITRKGINSICFPLSVGKSFPCEYKTLYGSIPMTVTATSIQNNLSIQGGSLFLTYDLEMGGGNTHHMMNLTVKKVTK